MTPPYRSARLATAVLTALVLAGCTAGPDADPVARESAPPSTPPASSPSPAASASAEPSPAPAIDCDTVLSTDGAAKLAADGLTAREPRVGDPLALQMVEAGALACTWTKPQTDITLTLVRLPMTDADWGTWSPALADAGFVETNEPVPGAYTGPVDGSGLAPVVVVADGAMTFVTVPAFAGLIALSQ